MASATSAGNAKNANLHFFKELIMIMQDIKNWGFEQKRKEDFDFFLNIEGKM